MKKVMFVCAENACRSQMAEAFMNDMAGERVAESAGTFPGEKVNSQAIEVMAEVGIDIASAKPKLFKLSDIDRFDRIISFGCIAKAAFPAPDRLEEWQIADPAGHSIAIFRHVRDEIKAHVQRLRNELGT